MFINQQNLNIFHTTKKQKTKKQNLDFLALMIDCTYVTYPIEEPGVFGWSQSNGW